MKTKGLLLFICAYFLCGYCEIKAQNKLGTVIYSILEPNEFRTEQGEKGWVLMDGGKDLWNTYEMEWRDTELFLIINTPQEMPDARGMFLRGMNHDGGVDPDSIRSAGDEQEDSFEKHSHKTSINTLSPGSGTDEGLASTNRLKFDDKTYGSNYPENPKIEWEGGDETRPKNIAIYIYIKVLNNE